MSDAYGLDGGRRVFLAASLAATVLPAEAARGAAAMYGLIGRMKAVSGKRDALAAIMLDGVGAMPGCLSYVVANDPADADALWITEVWDSAASHKASLQLERVKAAIAKGKPLIAAFDNYHETAPVGGHGLSRS